MQSLSVNKALNTHGAFEVDDEEFEQEAHEVPGVESMPESQEQQGNALRGFLTTQEPQPLKHIPTTHKKAFQ